MLCCAFVVMHSFLLGVLPQDEVKRKQKSLERNSNKHLCSELNKVTLADRFDFHPRSVGPWASLIRHSSLLVQVIDASDVVIEVLDARDPLGCRCPQLEEAVLQREGNKKLLLVLSKIGEYIYVVVYDGQDVWALTSLGILCCRFGTKRKRREVD